MKATVDAGIFKRNTKAGVDRILTNLWFDVTRKYSVVKSGFSSTMVISQEDIVEPVKKKSKNSPRRV